MSWTGADLYENAKSCLDYRGQRVLCTEAVRAAFIEAFAGRQFFRLLREPWLAEWSWTASLSHPATGWTSKLRVVFEYRGAHHYEPMLEQTGTTLIWQQGMDALLERGCILNQFALVVVPHTVPFTEMRDYVRRELARLGYKLAGEKKSDREFY